VCKRIVKSLIDLDVGDEAVDPHLDFGVLERHGHDRHAVARPQRALGDQGRISCPRGASSQGERDRGDDLHGASFDLATPETGDRSDATHLVRTSPPHLA